jgi:hypothetical protein
MTRDNPPQKGKGMSIICNSHWGCPQCEMCRESNNDTCYGIQGDCPCMSQERVTSCEYRAYAVAWRTGVHGSSPLSGRVLGHFRRTGRDIDPYEEFLSRPVRPARVNSRRVPV